MPTSDAPLLQFNSEDVEVVNKAVKYQGFFALHEYQIRHKLYRGGYSELLTREIFERGDAVAILPYDPITDSIVLVEQFRLGAIRSKDSPWQLELIAGMFSENEAPAEVAVREAKEEANLTVEVNKMIKIMDYLSSSGGSTEMLHLYCAQVDSSNVSGVYGLDEEGEDILVHVMSRSEAFELLKSGKIINAATIIGLQWLMLNLEQVRQL